MSTALLAFTSEELHAFATEVAREAVKAYIAEAAPRPKEPPYVHGIKGIMELFGVSETVAKGYKATFLAPAISQRGRSFTVDVAMARELFDDGQKTKTINRQTRK